MTSSRFSGPNRRGNQGELHGEQVPAQGVGPLLVEQRPGIDHVAHVFGHLAAFAVQDVAQAKYVAVAGVPGQQSAYGQQAVEPAAGLVDGLADKVRRRALLVDLLVLKGIVPLSHRHTSLSRTRRL